jgi:hypothetical protein
MLKYRHRKFGHIVEVDEPADVIAKADAEAEALTRIGTKRAKRDAENVGEYAQWQANRQRQTLARMDESRKWERYVEPPAPAAAAPAPVPTPPFAAEAKPTEAKPVKRTGKAESDD